MTMSLAVPLTFDQFSCNFDKIWVEGMLRPSPSVYTSLPIKKGSNTKLCTFMLYGESGIIGHKIDEKDGKKFVNTNFNLMRENDSNKIFQL